jgi:carboxypeptidase Q
MFPSQSRCSAVMLLAGLVALLQLPPALATQPPLQDDARRNAASLRDELVQPGLAYEIVESLTTEIGPRLAGSDADLRAVEWAEQRFRDLGFDRVWRVPVTFPYWQRGAESAEVLAPFPQPLHILALGGSVGTGDTPLDAEVVEFPTLSASAMAAATGLPL